MSSSHIQHHVSTTVTATASALAAQLNAGATASTHRIRNALALISDVCNGNAMRDLAQSVAQTRPQLAASLRRAARNNWS
jgi:hypothetical protein